MRSRPRLRVLLGRCSLLVHALACSPQGDHSTKGLQILTITRDPRVGHLFGGGDSVPEALLVDYVAQASDTQGLDAEAREVLNMVSATARRLNDSLVVIQQTTFVGPRSLGAVRGSFVAFRLRSSGSWEQLNAR